MSKIEVDAIDKQSGSTLTLGGSGTAVTLACGATQSGFGRSGSVNWQTTIKTGDFTAVSGEGYFVDTTSGEIDVTLPSSPSAGDIVAVSDYAKTFDTNNCIMLRNGSNIQGAASNLTLDAEGLAMTFVYADATKGWIVVGAGREADVTAATFMVATGGTQSNSPCGDYKIHTFTGPGTFCVSSVASAPSNNIADYVVVAGAGGGGAGCGAGGGGGAGGFRFFAGAANPQSGPGAPRSAPAGIILSVQGYPITVGAGGAGGTVSPNTCGTNGNPSTGLGITSTAGGGAGSGNSGPSSTGNPGGSGGGATRNRGSAGNGNTPPVSPPQGSNGGDGSDTIGGDGGGGAMAVGANNSSPGCAGNGGAGAGITGFGTSNGECSSSVQYFAGGGGGGNYKGCAATPS